MKGSDVDNVWDGRMENGNEPLHELGHRELMGFQDVVYIRFTFHSFSCQFLFRHNRVINLLPVNLIYGEIFISSVPTFLKCVAGIKFKMSIWL